MHVLEHNLYIEAELMLYKYNKWAYIALCKVDY